jgi:hypothetical protein
VRADDVLALLGEVSNNASVPAKKPAPKDAQVITAAKSARLLDGQPAELLELLDGELPAQLLELLDGELPAELLDDVLSAAPLAMNPYASRSITMEAQLRHPRDAARKAVAVLPNLVFSHRRNASAQIMMMGKKVSSMNALGDQVPFIFDHLSKENGKYGQADSSVW